MDLDDMSPEDLEAEMAKHIPEGHRAFGAKVLADHGVPELPPEEKHHELLGWTAVTAAPQVEAILRHDKAKLVANALGTPPPEVVAQIQESGRLVGALCGSVRHAQRHKDAGLDFVVCQGTEAAATAARWRRSCCGRRSSTPCRRCRCWPPAGSATGARWRRR